MPDVKAYGGSVQQVTRDPVEDPRPNRDQVVGKIMIRLMQRQMFFSRAETQHRRFCSPSENAEILGCAHW